MSGQIPAAIVGVASQAVQAIDRIANFKSVQFERRTADGLHKVVLIVSPASPKPQPKPSRKK